MQIILIPGLGFTDEIFKHLDFQGATPIYLNWLEPDHNESIDAYAQRMFEFIPATSGKRIIIGHSFGGMIAQEIAAIHPIDQIILISSIKSRRELPPFFKWSSTLGLYKILTVSLCTRSVKFWGKAHDYTETADIDLFIRMVSRYSDQYLQWALKTLGNWKKPDVPTHTSIQHIHGTLDKTFPFKYIQNPDKVVDQASHIMLYKSPVQINQFISSFIPKA